jgi:hypothetical protein
MISDAGPVRRHVAGGTESLIWITAEMQDILRAGVTKARLDPIARSAWLAAVYQSMRVAGGAVTTAVEEPTVGRNYYRVTVRLPDGSLAFLLLNAVARLVAAADPGQGDSIAASFVDVPHGEVFDRAGFRFADPCVPSPLEELVSRLRLGPRAGTPTADASHPDSDERHLLSAFTRTDVNR